MIMVSSNFFHYHTLIYCSKNRLKVNFEGMGAKPLIASQLPIENWYEMIGESTHADAILDRLVHGAIKLELKGESMRKKLNFLTDADHSS